MAAGLGVARRPLGARGGPTAPLLGFGVSGPHATPLSRRTCPASLSAKPSTPGRVFLTRPPLWGGEAERRLGEALEGVARRLRAPVSLDVAAPGS